MPFPNKETQWKPGQSGNPAGYSKKRRGLTDEIIRLVEEKGLEDALVRAGVAAALRGDFNFWRYIFERIDGPLPRVVEAEVAEVVTFERVDSPRDDVKPTGEPEP
jgi:hypothetical protein